MKTEQEIKIYLGEIETAIRKYEATSGTVPPEVYIQQEMLLWVLGDLKEPLYTNNLVPFLIPTPPAVHTTPYRDVTNKRG